MVTVLYRLTFSSGKAYIGKTERSLAVRMAHHVHRAKHGVYAVHHAIAKYGMPEPEVLLVCEEVDASQYERVLIHLHGTLAPGGYNLTEGGEGTSGHRHTAESLQRMSESHKGQPNPNKGRTMSDAAKVRMRRAAQARRDRDPEAARSRAAHMRAARILPESEETRRKRSESMKAWHARRRASH